jgi:soluble lytic murein transglycosylase-like protein
MAALTAIALEAAWAAAQPPVAPLNRAETRSLILAAARLYDLDPDLLGAIAAVESGGNSQAVSPKGAQGLMQLMPATAERFSVGNPFDPVDNVLGAVRFINFIKRRQAERPELQGSLAALLAAYNAGPGAVEKYGGVPPYPETQEYVRRVMLAYLLGGDLPANLRRVPHRAARSAAANQTASRTATAAPARGRSADLLDQLSEIQNRRAAEQKRMAAEGWVEPHGRP